MIKILFVIFQLVILIFILLISLLFTWYEGSEVLERPWEWNKSTPFSNLINGEVNNKSDILQIDFFIYAIKYKPMFPTFIIICSLYLFYLIGIFLFKTNYNKLILFLFFSGLLLIIISLMLLPIYTPGILIIFYILIIIGTFSVIISTILFFKKRKFE
ncbi:DUF4306 domain-containing protein [Sutcliffiella cohnii]